MSKLSLPSAGPAARRAKASLQRDAKARKLIDSYARSRLDTMLQKHWEASGERWVSRAVQVDEEAV